MTNDEKMINKEELLDWLRKEIKLAKSTSDMNAREAGKVGDAEGWDVSRILLGEAFGYERLIKHLKGLNEREFQLQKKRGIL